MVALHFSVSIENHIFFKENEMNISQHIDEWSRKILKEAIEEGYNPSKDEFKQSDELKGADDYEAAQEYEKWMKDREKIMKELAPKSTNEGCCDEKEEASTDGEDQE